MYSGSSKGKLFPFITLNRLIGLFIVSFFHIMVSRRLFLSFVNKIMFWSAFFFSLTFALLRYVVRHILESRHYHSIVVKVFI